MLSRFVFALLLLLGSGAFASPRDEDSAVRLGGSTTLLPAIAQCASEFMEKYETWDKADPSLPKEKTVVFVTGGGSGFGVKALVQGTVHCGLLSRDLKDDEKKSIGDARSVLVGRDGVAFAVSRKSPLSGARRGFTREELTRIFSGDVKTFREIDASLPEREFALFVRDASGGAAEIVQKEILKKREVSPKAVQIPSQGAMLKKLEGNPNAFGYIALGLALQSEELQTFEVDGVAPTRQTVLDGKYPLSRNLFLVTKGAPEPKLRKFIEYVAKEGQKVLEAQGYVPVATDEK